MSGHTPGPWMVSELNGRDVGPVRLFGFEGTDVRQLLSVALVRERAESDANAHLIAAAPELLDAAKQARDWCDKGGPIDWALITPFRNALRAAIAKAEGR